MDEKLIKIIKESTNQTLTENIAVTKLTSNSELLDLFSTIGALRNAAESDIVRRASRAISDQTMEKGKVWDFFIRILFYTRDIRGGLGERRVFRVILEYLAESYPEVVLANLDNINFYGRWDDFYALFGTKLEKEAAEHLKNQFKKDLEVLQDPDGSPSLLGKWLKSENTSSEKSRKLARKTIKHFNISHSTYRKSLSKLRERINVVERLMSQNRWEEIVYSNVPSKASMTYRDAFRKHDPEGYNKFISEVEKGNQEIKAATIFPYEIVRKIFNNHKMKRDSLRVLEAQWRALPDYGAIEDNAMAVVDTSGSMHINDFFPLSVAISLGLYFAERNTAPGFHNKFFTFSSAPDLIEVKGRDIREKLFNMRDENWGANTDLESLFELVLSVARENNLSQEDLPQKLFIISDMQFDEAVSFKDKTALNNKTFIQKMKYKYEKHNYSLPHIVFWNVASRHIQSPVTMSEEGFHLVSGCSPSIFKAVVDANATTPFDIMLEILSKKRYDRIVNPFSEEK